MILTEVTYINPPASAGEQIQKASALLLFCMKDSPWLEQEFCAWSCRKTKPVKYW